MAGLIALLAAEALFVWKRDYINTDPELPIRAEFGDPSHPRLRFVVLGDSTSIGLGTVPEASYPWRLAKRLGEQLHVELTVLGRSGARTQDVAATQVPGAVALEPDLVLIEIGANDATHATPIKKVRVQATRAVRDLQRAGIDVVIAGPPGMGTSRAFPQPLRALSGWNGRRVERAIKSVAAAEGVEYLELASHTAPAFRGDPERYYSSDGFHPGAAGYALWADVMYPGVLEAARKAATLSPAPTPASAGRERHS